MSGVRRIGRYILNGLTVLSLVLCLGLSGVWVWSYWRTPFVRILIAPPAKLKAATTSQAEAWERSGSRGVYLSRYLAAACDRGSLYVFLDQDGEADLSGNFRRARFLCGRDATKTLVTDEEPAIASSGIGQAVLWQRFGFGYYRHTMGMIRIRRFETPMWLACALTLVLPATWARGYFVRRRWARTGRCARCGYDLRATPDRCPECGTIPTKVKA
jgi:hypothetical protein